MKETAGDKRWTVHAWPLALLAAVPLCLLGWAVVGLVFLGSGDALVYYFPVRLLWTQSIAKLSFPLWIELLYAGYPLAADIQTAGFYPLNLIHLFLSPLAGHNATVLLHLILAGFFTYGLTLHYGMERRAALMAGIIFTLPGCSFSHMGFYPFSASLAWMPAVLLAVARYLRRPTAGRWAAAALVWTAQILAGFPQLVLYTGLAAGVLAVFHVLRSRGYPWRVIGGIGGMGIAAMGLAAIQIIPTVEMVRLGPRTAISFENFALGSLNPEHLLAALISPGAMSTAAWASGDWPSALYGIYFVGVFPFVALVSALARKPWKAKGEPPVSQWSSFAMSTWFPWAGIAVIFALLATGGQWPLGSLLYHIPLMNLFQVQARCLAVVDLALAVLAGFAMDSILRSGSSHGAQGVRLPLAMGALGLVCISLALGFLEKDLWRTAIFNNFRDPQSMSSGNVAAEVVLLLALAGVTAIVIHGASRTEHVKGTVLLAGAIILPLAAFTPLDILSIPARTMRLLMEGKPKTIQAMEADREQGASAGRVCALSRFLFLSSDSWVEEYARLALPDLNIIYGIRQIGLYGPLQHTRYNQFIGEMSNNATFRDTRFLSQWVADVLGVRFILVQSGFPWRPDPDRHTKIYTDGTVELFRNERALPRAWLVPMTIPEEAMGKEYLSTLNPQVTAPVEAAFAGILQGSDALQAGEEVVVINLRDGRVEMDVLVNKRRFLAVGIRHYPGWRVRMDDEKRPPVRAYGFLMGAYVEPGRHRVVFEFRPASLFLGAALSLVTGVGLLSFVLWSSSKNPRRS